MMHFAMLYTCSLKRMVDFSHFGIETISYYAHMQVSTEILSL